MMKVFARTLGVAVIAFSGAFGWLFSARGIVKNRFGFIGKKDIIMPTIEQIADEILEREGGFVNDPDDAGGPTNHGVTLATMRRHGLDLNGDGAVDITDVTLLTPYAARDLYIDAYYRKPGIDKLPADLAPAVFDMNVNAGSNAIKILQRVLNDAVDAVLIVDGAIGPMTIAAAHRAARINGILLRDAYGIARRNFYYRLADRRPANRKFARTRAGGKGGWIRRAEAYIQPKYHLSAAQHKARCAAW